MDNKGTLIWRVRQNIIMRTAKRANLTAEGSGHLFSKGTHNQTKSFEPKIH